MQDLVSMSVCLYQVVSIWSAVLMRTVSSQASAPTANSQVHGLLCIRIAHTLLHDMSAATSSFLLLYYLFAP